MNSGVRYEKLVSLLRRGRYDIAQPFRGIYLDDVPSLAGRYSGRYSVGHGGLEGCRQAVYVSERLTKRGAHNPNGHQYQSRRVLIHIPGMGCTEQQLVFGSEVLKATVVDGTDTYLYGYEEMVELACSRGKGYAEVRFVTTRYSRWTRDGVVVQDPVNETTDQRRAPIRLDLPAMVMNRAVEIVHEGARPWVDAGRPLADTPAYMALAEQLPFSART